MRMMSSSMGQRLFVKGAGIVLLFPALILGGSAVVSWQANTESDLGGYQIYYGTSSNFYSVTLDVGKVTQYTVNNLLAGSTYYFAVTAYDTTGNESVYSQEASLLIQDIAPPTVVSSACEMGDRVKVVFSEALEKASAELITNYSINNGITVSKATLQTDQKTVYLTTTQHVNRWYILTINNVRDASSNGNMIAANTQTSYQWQGGDTQPPTVSKIELLRQDFLAVTFSEALNQSSATAKANYSISPSIQILSSGIDVNTLTTVYLSTGAHTPGQAYSLTINNVKDGSANANTIAANTKANYTCTSGDANPPVLVAARLTTNSQLQVEFNEKVETGSAQNIANYTITPSVRVISAVLNTEKTIIILTTDPHSAGNYTVTVRNVGDANATPNIMTSGSLGYSYTPPDVTLPTLSAVSLTTDDLLQVTFSEAVDNTSAQTVANYSITPAVRIISAMLNVTQTTVMLQTDRHSAGTYTLRVSNVKDLATLPNTIMAGSSKTYSYTPLDATPPTLQNAVLYGSNLVELIFSEALDRSIAESITHYTIPGITASSAVLVGDSQDRVQLTTSAHQPGQSYTVQVSGIKDKALNTMSTTTKAYSYLASDGTPPKLLSAALTGGNQFLELVFNEPVTQATAEVKSNYNIGSGITVEAATLDAQGTKVFLKTTTHTAGVNYMVTVLNVRDISGNAITSDNQKTYSATSQDILPPQLSRADLIDDNTLELTFNEPVEPLSAANRGNYSIDNGISVIDASLSGTQMQVWLTTYRHQRGIYKVTASNIKDMAAKPNTLTQGQASYSYQPPDTSAPKLLLVKAQTETMIELTFSEQLDRTTAQDIIHYMVNNGVVVEKAILDADMIRVYLQTTKQPAGQNKVTVSGLKDASSVGNSIPSAVSMTYDFNNLDRTPPVVQEVKVISQTMVNLRFSEALNQQTAANPGNYLISGNVKVNTASLTYSGIEVILETSPQAAGEYTLTINGVKDASSQQNPITAYTQVKYTWAPLDTTGPSLTEAKLNTNALLELSFDEALDAASSKNPANYAITPAIRVITAVLDDSQMKVWLYTDNHVKGTYTVTASGLKDRAFKPNLIGKRNRFQYVCLPPDTSAPKLVSATLNTPTSLKIVFDEEVTRETAEVVANYGIEPKVDIKQAYLRATLTEVYLETAAHQSKTNYVLRVRGIKDRTPGGNTILNAVTTTYSYVAPDTTPPVLKQAKLQHPNLLELLFNKTLEQSSAENRDNYRIDPSVEVLDATLDTATLVKVYLSTTTHMPGVGYGINVKNVRDRNTIPNTIKPTTWMSYAMAGAGTMADKTPPYLARVDMISPTQIDLIFSKPLSSASAENKNNYVIEDSITVKTAKIDTNLVKVHLTTTEHRVGKAYRIVVKNLADRATKPNLLSVSPAVQYLLAKGMSVSNPSRSDYRLAMFGLHKPGYMDRDYQISKAPDCLNGAVQILTSNNDKTAVDDVFLTFELRGAATVYVAFDKGIADLPAWLSDWKSTGDQVIDSRATAYQLYSKKTIGGRFSLGSNQGGMDDNMYLAFITPNMGNGLLLSKLSRTSYIAAQVGIGDPYYIDRDYTVASMPDSVGEYFWIRTANDDKMNRDEDFLSFTTTMKTELYLAYDSKISSLPKWLMGWELAGGKIVDSRGARFDLYRKTCEAGDVTLGGNCGTLDDNMYIVLLKALDGTGHDTGFTDMPGYFTLSQNYPNPFNPKTTIQYVVHKDGHLKITVFNVLGQTVRVLVNADFKAGTKDEVVWDATDQMGNSVSSGVYFYRIEQDQFAKTRRMLLLR
jgi:hypothetical protein